MSELRSALICSLPLGLLAVGILLAAQPPAFGQSLEVQNGATVAVQNGTTWNLEGTTMDFGPVGSTAQLDEQSEGRITGGQLTAVRALENPSSANPAGLGLQITASVDLGDVEITRGHSVQTAQNGNESIGRYYDVGPSQNNGGLDAELTFAYNDAELNGRNESELEFFRSDDSGSTWSEAGFDTRDAAANTVTLSGIASMSRWTLGSESAPLPVELAGFDGVSTPEGIRLTWKTTSETNNAGFEIQRKRTGGPNAGSWEKIGFVDSKTGNGTTSKTRSYAFTDADLPYAADKPQYRLRQVDVNGEETLTSPVTVERTVGHVELRSIFPNPAREQVTVRFSVPENQPVMLQMYDILGRQVQTSVRVRAEGRQERKIDISNLSTGTYFLRLGAGNKVRTRKLTIVR